MQSSPVGHVVDNGFRFCSERSHSGFTLTDKRLLGECSRCDRFYLRCCTNHSSDLAPGIEPMYRGDCRHRWLLSFVDGALGKNWNGDTIAGLGVAAGTQDYLQISKPTPRRDVYAMDSGDITSAAVELLAATVAVVSLKESLLDGPGRFTLPRAYLILSDSEYVVKGVRIWYDDWRDNDWRTSENRTPANFVLWNRLMLHLEELEARGINVGFVHIRRELNKLADKLANDSMSGPIIPKSDEEVLPILRRSIYLRE